MASVSGSTGPCTTFCALYLFQVNNTTPHQSTGESPHYFMFGQEPRLPVDFLLGRVEKTVAGNVYEWVIEHQTRLSNSIAGGFWRVAAECRKVQHDSRVRDTPLSDGQLFFLCNDGVRGRSKIQDLWSPVVYQVVRARKEGGSVYSIAPVDELDKVRQVHRSLLKVRTQKDFPVQISTRSPVVESVPPLGEQVSSEQEDLWVLGPETPPAAGVEVLVDPGCLGSLTCSGLGDPANLGQPLEDALVQLPESWPDGDVVP